ncbi:MAG: two-component system LytT family sensor kinase [Paraglaciecola sp.]|jgi:two-component system LytT family sensor kinase
MFKKRHTYFPSLSFLFFNLIFWLLLNGLAADNTHRMRLYYGNESDYWSVWIEYFPWWSNWAVVAPIVIALVRRIDIEGDLTFTFFTGNLLVLMVSMTLYWTLTLVEITLMGNNYHFDMEAFRVACEHLFTSPLHMDLLVYAAIASLGFTMSYYSRAKAQAVYNQRLSNQLLNVELQSLKSQLSPHFLFNTLNTISGLIRLEHKDKAVKALSELSLMFRKVLENQKTHLTSLNNEIEFINSYLTIQKMRFENKLAVEMDVSEQSLDVQVPFMLLHTLVENAVQHGSQLESEQNLLKLVITTDDQVLSIRLVNKVAKHRNHQGFGIGLSNCKKRLQHIYGGNYTLICKETDDSYFETILILPTGGLHA